MDDDLLLGFIKAAIAGFFVGFAVILVMLMMALANDSRRADDSATMDTPTEERSCYGKP